MPGIPYKYAESFALLRRATDHLHRLMESGEFYSLSYLKRRKLLRRVRRLYNRLAGPISPALIGTALAAAGVLALAGCGPRSAIQPSFGPAVSNPFGLDGTHTYAALLEPSIADIDAAGDLDLVTVHGWYANRFWENTGTTTSAIFPSGSVRADLAYTGSPGNGFIGKPLEFADLDNDGDVDAISAASYGVAFSYEKGAVWQANTPTEGNPVFGTPQILFTDGGYPHSPVTTLTAADIDNDGDQDLLYVVYNEYGGDQQAFFAENIGTSESPNFGTPVLLDDAGWGVGLDLTDQRIHGVEAGDFDQDGDIDIIVSAYYENIPYPAEARIYYLENTGRPGTPRFAAPLINQFGMLPPEKDWRQANNWGGGMGLTSGDMDGDGDLDLLLGPYTRFRGAGDFPYEFFYFENEPTRVLVEEPPAAGSLF